MALSTFTVFWGHHHCPSFFRLNNVPPSVHGHWGCFPHFLLWITLLWTSRTKFCVPICFHLSWEWNSWVTWWLYVNLLRSCQDVVHSSCTIFIPTSQTWVPSSPRPHQHLLFSIFLVTAVLMVVQRHRVVVSVYILCTHWLFSSLEKFLWKLLPICELDY